MMLMEEEMEVVEAGEHSMTDDIERDRVRNGVLHEPRDRVRLGEAQLGEGEGKKEEER